VANDDEYLRAGYIMVKRIVAFTLLIITIILFLACYAEDTLLLRNEDCSVEVTEYMGKSAPQFLSDEYFYELDELFEQLNKENGHWNVFT
jgi:hypothetical protein